MGKRVAEDVTTKRREIVSALRRRAMSLDEIHQQLATEFLNINNEIVPNPTYFPNPKTGEPFDRTTIFRDIEALRKQANERAAQNADEIRAELFDRSEELYRIAIKQKKYGGALEVLKFVAKLTGANRPEKKELRWDDDQLETMKSAKQTLRDKLKQVGLQTIGAEDE